MLDRSQLNFPVTIFQFIDSLLALEYKDSALSTLLGVLKINEEEFHDPSSFLNGEQVFTLLKLADKHFTDEPPAHKILRYFSINNMGMAGIASRTALTLRESLNFAEKYYPMLLPSIKLDLANEGENVVLYLDLEADFEHLNNLLKEILLGTFSRFATEILGETPPITIEFSHSPTWGDDTEKTIALYKNAFNCEVKFNCDRNAISGLDSILDARLKSPNVIMHEYARKSFIKELEAINIPKSIGEKVKRILIEEAKNDQYLDLTQMAERLNLSSRTLSRKLSSDNIQYRTLVNKIRFEKAQELLKKTDLPIKALGHKVGFSNSDAFIRAFKAYSGKTPIEWKANYHKERSETA